MKDAVNQYMDSCNVLHLDFLRFFALDPENARSDVVKTATGQAIPKLLALPVAEGQETLEEFVAACRTSGFFVLEMDRQYCVGTVIHDVTRYEGYGNLFARVWGCLRTHPHRGELFVRLLEEIVDGYNTCVSGKIARLVNVLRGYDTEITM
jgi:hypothetical protein